MAKQATLAKTFKKQFVTFILSKSKVNVNSPLAQHSQLAWRCTSLLRWAGWAWLRPPAGCVWLRKATYHISAACPSLQTHIQRQSYHDDTVIPRHGTAKLPINVSVASKQLGYFCPELRCFLWRVMIRFYTEPRPSRTHITWNRFFPLPFCTYIQVSILVCNKTNAKR